MTRFSLFATAAALAVALPALALAQAEPTADPNATMPDQTATAPSAATTGMNASAGPVSADQLPAGQASALAAGDNKLLSNGPVPDTAANRHRFGGPMSHAGKRTAPAGN